jgi:hypothetical protein
MNPLYISLCREEFYYQFMNGYNELYQPRDFFVDILNRVIIKSMEIKNE